jgi:hypothetical protein
MRERERLNERENEGERERENERQMIFNLDDESLIKI